MGAKEFEAWIDEVVDAQCGGVHTNLAKALGLTLSPYRQMMKKGSFGIDPLLRLADLTGKSATWILRLAGKGDTADLIEMVYGPAASKPNPLTLEERELLRLFRAMEPGARTALLAIASAVKKVAHQDTR
jgi:hypothetical protein